MLFDEFFLASLRSEPVVTTATVYDVVRKRLSDGQEWDESDHAILLEAYALMAELIEAKLVPIEFALPPVVGSVETDCPKILQFLENIQKALNVKASMLKLESTRSHFRHALGGTFSYEFSQGDLDRLQHLINEIRTHIAGITDLTAEHKQRLLRRLEKLQGELHKKVSDLDRFWGLIGDAGVVLGKLGTDAKPIVDRVREIADIVWQTQSRSEELPTGTKLPLLQNKSSG